MAGKASASFANYRKTAELAPQIPEWPTLFIKGRSALANPEDAIEVFRDAQDTMDLEGEVGTPCTDNARVSDSLRHSARLHYRQDWQKHSQREGVGSCCQ